MCGRYFVTESQQQFLLRNFRRTAPGSLVPEGIRRSGDVCPTDHALVMVSGPRLCRMRWGYPGGRSGRMVINARSESAAQRPMFAQSLLGRRCVLPCAGFYEWNEQREKVTFTRLGSPILFLAGIYDFFDEESFVILTTAANASVAPVHDRMPLLIEPAFLSEWLRGGNQYLSLLERPMPELRREIEDHQLSFADLY